MSEKSGSQEGGLEPKKTNLLKSSLAMASGTLISRVLGFVRSALLVAAIGVTAGTAAAFNLANTLPNMVYNLLAAGIVNAILIPQIVRALKSRSGAEYVSKLLTAAGTILFGVTVAAMAATPLLITILAPTLPGPVRALTISFALICVPQIFFYGVYNLLGELLNARGIFGPYMWAPVVNNVIGIASLLVFLKIWGSAGEVVPAETFTNTQILVLAGGSTLGVVLQALVLLIPLRNAGVPLRLDFRFKGTSFGSAPKVAGWTFATLMVSQVGVISTTNLVSRGDTFTELTGEVVAGLQAYQYAFMLFMVPQSLIAVTIATAMFTRIANDVANKDFQAVADNYHRGVQLILLFSFAAAAALLVAADPIMTMMMPSFGPTAASHYGAVLAALLLGLPSIGLNLMSQRIFFAIENAKPVFLIGIVPAILQLIVGWGIYFVTDAQWWTVGAAAGETASRFLQGFISIIWVSVVIRQVNAKRLLSHYVKYFSAFAVSAAAGWAVNHYLLPNPTTASTSLRLFDGAWQTVVLGLVVGVVYFATLRLVDPQGFAASTQAVLSRLHPSTKQTAEELEEVEELGELEGASPEAPGSFSNAEMDLLAESGAFAAEGARAEGETHHDGESGTEQRPAEAKKTEEADPRWGDVGAGEGASWALSRNLSGAEVASTGAIPILTGELPVGKEWGSKTRAFSRWKSPVPRSREQNDRTQGGARGVAQDNLLMTKRESRPMNSQNEGAPTPPPSRGVSSRFDPTMPTLVIAFLLLLGGGTWALKTAFPGSANELFEAFSAGTSQSAGQSQSSGGLDEEETTEQDTPVNIPVIAGIHLLSWSDDEGDHPELIGHLTDSNPETTWRSRYFQDNTFAEGSEIALLINLAEPALVTEVDMTVLGSGGEVVIVDASEGDARSGEVLATSALEPDTVIKLAQPTELSALGVQFMSLPTDDEGLFRAKISNIEVK